MVEAISVGSPSLPAGTFAFSIIHSRRSSGFEVLPRTLDEGKKLRRRLLSPARRIQRGVLYRCANQRRHGHRQSGRWLEGHHGHPRFRARHGIPSPAAPLRLRIPNRRRVRPKYRPFQRSVDSSTPRRCLDRARNHALHRPTDRHRVVARRTTGPRILNWETPLVEMASAPRRTDDGSPRPEGSHPRRRHLQRRTVLILLLTRTYDLRRLLRNPTQHRRRTSPRPPPRTRLVQTSIPHQEVDQ